MCLLQTPFSQLRPLSHALQAQAARKSLGVAGSIVRSAEARGAAPAAATKPQAGEEAQRLSGWLQGPARVCFQAELPTGRGERPKKSGVCRKPPGQLMARPIPALRLQGEGQEQQQAAPAPSLWHRLLYLALACLQRQAGVSLPRELLTFVGVALTPETEIL